MGVINMSTKKIFYKKDLKDILLFLEEESLATLNENYKGCKLELENDGKQYNLIITDALGNKYKEFFPNTKDYDTLYKNVSEHFSVWEKEYIQGESKTLEEVMQEKAEVEKSKAEQEENKNFDLLNQYIATGEENFYCDCLTYYNDKKNLGKAIDKLIHKEIENYSCSQFKVAFYLKTVYDKKLYEVQGFKNIYDYANEEFNIARGTVSNWLMIANNFGILNSDTGFYSLDERLKDFSITQLVLVRQLTIEQIQELGIIPSMTTRQLKALIKEKLNINAIATSVKADVDTSNIPVNPENEEELYSEAEAIDTAMNEPTESTETETTETVETETKQTATADNIVGANEKVKARLIIKGGTELSKNQIEYLNMVLKSQPSNKDIKLLFVEIK